MTREYTSLRVTGSKPAKPWKPASSWTPNGIIAATAIHLFPISAQQVELERTRLEALRVRQEIEREEDARMYNEYMNSKKPALELSSQEHLRLQIADL